MMNIFVDLKRKNFIGYFKAVLLFCVIYQSAIHIGMASDISTEHPYISLMGTNQDTTGLSDMLEIKDVPIIEEEPAEVLPVFQVVEVMPKFPGGNKAMNRYLQQNIIYPKECLEQGVQGRVIVQFVVNSDGSIENPKVVKPNNPYLDKEAIRVVATMPKWIPGNQRGKTLRVQMTIPVTFVLPND